MDIITRLEETILIAVWKLVENAGRSRTYYTLTSRGKKALQEVQQKLLMAAEESGDYL